MERAGWAAALAALLAAAGAGLMWRGMVATQDVWLNLSHLRHAHSHVMLVGWASPALMLWILRALRERGQHVNPRAVAAIVATLWISALVSLPAFALWGYGAATLGTHRLPISIIASTINMLGWYAFAALYWRARRGTRADSARWCWDAAVASLALATIGGWSRAALMAAHIDAPALAQVSVHALVDVFTEGWLTLGVFGLWVARARLHVPHWARVALIAGVATSCLMAPAPGVLPTWLRALASPGGVALGLTWIAAASWLWRARSALPATLWAAPAWLALKGAMLIANASPQLAAWGHATGLRIVYIHVALVAVVSVGLIEQAHSERAPQRTARSLHAAIALMLCSFAAQVIPSPAARWAAVAGGLIAAAMLLGRGAAALDR